MCNWKGRLWNDLRMLGLKYSLQAVYRENFKEAKILKSFAKLNLKHREISITDFLNKKWDENFLQNPKK